MIGPLKAFRRWRLRRRPFPEAWRAHLRRHLACHARMPDEWRDRYERMVQVFVAEKHWIPAAGMRITDEIKVVIAGAACRLVLRLDLSYLDRLTEIVVYPHAYRHEGDRAVILGEAHHWGTVVLSWPAVLAGLADPCDGHDTAVHEFAHVLDRDAGSFNGTPFLRARADYAPWAQVMMAHFERLRAGAIDPELLRSYGATNPAEFFAVATEAFFERPDALQQEMPDLYAVMRRFYGGDPFTWGLCPTRL
jgi:Mlc titration factor MtfA (ptsG expression regulator)